MNYYETVFIARQDLSQNQVEALAEQCSAILTERDGKILKTEHWGLRTLAYKIRKSRKAYYVLIESQSSPDAIHEMERTMRLNEDILRYMTVRLEEPSNGPSPILDRDRDRDSRPRRFDRDDDRSNAQEEAA